jgi:hypothetical protein
MTNPVNVLRRFRTLTSPISVMPTVHQKHALFARWVALTDTIVPLRTPRRQGTGALQGFGQQWNPVSSNVVPQLTWRSAVPRSRARKGKDLSNR